MVIFTTIFALLFGYYDSTVIKHNHQWNKDNPTSAPKRLNHTWRVLLRVFVIMGMSGVLASSLLDFALLTLIGASVFWIVFELCLNSFMGWSTFHVGTTAGLDILVRRVGAYLQKVFNLYYFTIGEMLFGFKLILFMIFSIYWLIKN
jgi:hypothetical protein